MPPLARAILAQPVTPTSVVPIDDLLPWSVDALQLRPYDGMWAFNPSVHYDGETWRCVVRCSDYALPGGIQIRSSRAHPTGTRTLNAMAILDPAAGWQPTHVLPMIEVDDHPRQPCANTGYEDIRLFRTTEGGLQGIAASLQLGGKGSVRHPEQVLLTFDEIYRVTSVLPLRGVWSAEPQKNWTPFDHCEEPRFMYAIDDGIVYDAFGRVSPAPTAPPAPVLTAKPRRKVGRAARMARRAQDLVSGKSAAHDGLRGGSQLVHVGDDRWLGIGHRMCFHDGRKFYWHQFYTVDDTGALTGKSVPLKLAKEWIEFAAGLAVDPVARRVVISFGVDDMRCRIGTAPLDAVLALVHPMDELARRLARAPVAVVPSSAAPLTNAELAAMTLPDLRRAYITLRDSPHPIAVLSPRTPHISPALLTLAEEHW